MADFDIKCPTSQAEYDEIKKMLRTAISDDDAEAIVGGNDDLKGKAKIPWTCHFCGATIMCKAVQDAAKHMTKCPNNPFK